MKIKNIYRIEDIYDIQYRYNKYEKIVINIKKLKYTGTLRYAFKYALWALKVEGELLIKDDEVFSKDFSIKRINFSQIKNEFFNTLKNDIKLVELNDKNGIIKVEKVKENYINNGFSFGIIFSGSQEEVNQLTRSIRSILDNKDIDEYSYEIIICGPSSFYYRDYLKQFSNYKIKYLEFNFEENAKRIMISEKKSYLYENCIYNIVSINHTRILYSNEFVIKSFSRKFDIFTPQVVVYQNLKEYRYLDFGLLASYDLSKMNTKKILTGKMLTSNIFYFMKHRVPYIDGGLTTFNKNIITYSPYNKNIAWGEAEDIIMSSILYNYGYLLDYFSDIHCVSITIKVNIKDNIMENLKEKIRKYLIIKGCC